MKRWSKKWFVLILKQIIRTLFSLSEKGLPDLIILEAANGFHGLCIEMKRTGEKIFKRNGELLKDAHLHEQYALIKKLQAKGYYAVFCIGFEAARNVIEKYMKDGPASP